MGTEHNDSSAISAQPTHFWVVWEDEDGKLIRTIYRWAEHAAKGLARILLDEGAKRVWLMKSNEAMPWNTRKMHKGVEMPVIDQAIILRALRRAELTPSGA